MPYEIKARFKGQKKWSTKNSFWMRGIKTKGHAKLYAKKDLIGSPTIIQKSIKISKYMK